MSVTDLRNAIINRRRAFGGGGSGGGGIVDGESAAASLVALGTAARAELLAGLARGNVPPGQAWLQADDDSGVEGLALAAGVEATQADVLAGTDTDKDVSPAAAGGWAKPRTIAYASTLTMDFTGTTPVWGAENIVNVTAALTLQAENFPAFMERKEFSVTFVRASGTGNISIQSNGAGAAVEYRNSLSASDIPPLGTTVGDRMTVRGKCQASGLWTIEAFGGKTA